MTKEQELMLKKALSDLEDSIEAWQKVINGAEEAKIKAIEEIKEVKRLIKGLR